MVRARPKQRPSSAGRSLGEHAGDGVGEAGGDRGDAMADGLADVGDGKWPGRHQEDDKGDSDVFAVLLHVRHHLSNEDDEASAGGLRSLTFRKEMITSAPAIVYGRCLRPSAD